MVAVAVEIVASILPGATNVRLYETSTISKTDPCELATGTTIQRVTSHDVDIANYDEEAAAAEEGAMHNSGYGAQTSVPHTTELRSSQTL